MDRVVLVTGGSQGIGLAIARSFLEAGDRVVLNDRSEEQVARGIERLAADSSRVHGCAADVTRRDQVEAMVEEALRVLGRLDVVVNNAGVYPVTPVLEMSEAEWDWVLGVNLKGVFLVSQAAARQMVARGRGGVMVNISSGSHKIARLGCGHYCASKAGVVMLTQVMAMELAPHGIRVNAVAPGLIHVPEAVTPSLPQHLQGTLSVIPWGRLGRPEDVAGAVRMLCSREAEYITGAVLAVDGGLSAGRMPPPAANPVPGLS
jgi:NAD(P)-dependent dehydrogenase (short-subunit alcohol dehydrogenase family)